MQGVDISPAGCYSILLPVTTLIDRARHQKPLYMKKNYHNRFLTMHGSYILFHIVMQCERQKTVTVTPTVPDNRDLYV